MAVHGRQSLRDLFDESPTPHIAHPPRTHHRHFYVATDGSYRSSGDGGLGVVIETRDGTRVARVAVPDAAPNNNVSEYRALHLGLDVLAARAPPNARVGVLIDHDALAADVNTEVLAGADPDWRRTRRPTSPPAGSENHWRGIRARIAGFAELRAARIDGRNNPAHPLANAPGEYAHVNGRNDRCVMPDPPSSNADLGTGTGTEADDPQFPPPSRFESHASD
ncbi:ribonuclease H [Halogeometricum luteum]|uniref:Ribonuclease H n=1 Tax=Halogeometricum luteum TaxID=2950537 RepID=A0ABU2G148_9EURY|nr:ribonuclease H [Halogeometricum sp. S3BR5-2]MDS0294511.1 ribonuclease H [Halogeometricum sp. S3BR5-2]